MYVSENGGAFTLYQKNILDSAIVFIGRPGSTYCFFTQATDNVLNAEERKNACEAVTMVGAIGLMVSWLSFKGEQVREAVVLTWATANEASSKPFNVEKSVDGVRFEKIRQVATAGNSTQTRYTTLPITKRWRKCKTVVLPPEASGCRREVQLFLRCSHQHR
ncbi:hypothetical protein HRH25_12950 [Flavisolibacter sp. BT320]|nr:hypothetical protein [Flavisolibacter longurius]